MASMNGRCAPASGRQHADCYGHSASGDILVAMMFRRLALVVCFTSAWSCAPGDYGPAQAALCCSGDCNIDGQCLLNGQFDQNNPCRFCLRTTASCMRTWTNEEDGVACDDGLDCTMDTACSTGDCTGGTLMAGFCVIDGACIAEGAVNPANPCQACDTAMSTSAYSPRANDTVCDDGDPCTMDDGRCMTGACVATPIVPCTVNRAPTALITGPLEADSLETITLSGATSTDPDGDTLTYLWAQTGGPNVTFSSMTTASVDVTFPVVTVHSIVTFTLVVSDGTISSPMDAHTVGVHPPVTPPDAGGSVDAGSEPPVDDGGCGCRSTSSRNGSGLALALLVVGLAAWRRRRSG